MKVVAANRRALVKYHILETYEAGVSLTGSEVKSIRAGKANLQDSFGRIENEEAYLFNAHIPPYESGGLYGHSDPTRRRKLLLHKVEIRRLMGKLMIKGLTLIPLELYFSDKGLAKVKLGLGKGKTAPDHRDEIRKNELGREMRREFKGRHKL